MVLTLDGFQFLFSTLKAYCIVFVFDVMNNFCTHERYEIVTVSSTPTSDIGGCSGRPNTAYCERYEAIWTPVDLS